ncbi:IclR family transcriptional regulator C-terminal domain-containing protein [Aeromicrobium panaciterrae]|uniref:IclR family transcriptional regulator domain-containing protein n=1 Tax=Aeromicrobium panaciterrae TaxID=363861 RepID=UPI0031D04701
MALVENDRDIDRTSEHVQSLERGLIVIRVFAEERGPLTLTEVAERGKLSKAVARRLLMTLESLGYVGRDHRQFYLLPRTLELGYSYLTSLSLTEILQPNLTALAAAFHEDCSAAVLGGDHVTYIVRAKSGHITNSGLAVGDRVPAHTVSTGMVLLADLTPEELDTYFATSDRQKFTDKTVVDEKALREELDLVRRQGWSLVQSRLSPHVLAISVPVRGVDGRAVAALKVGSQATQRSGEQMIDDVLPALLQTAADISYNLSLNL